MRPWQHDQLRRALERAGASATAPTASASTAGVEIGYERLSAEPAAARCLECQARHEKIYRR